MDDKKQARYQSLSQGFHLAMIILGAIAAMNFVGHLTVGQGVSLSQIAAGLATICGLVSGFYEKRLPPRSGPLAPSVPK